jgi:hypothetical protein
MLDELDLLSLNAPAGTGQTNDPADIAALDNSLRRIDTYTPPPEYADEPQRYATEPMIRALEKFQEQNGLKVDGYANPGGPTERAINNRLLAKPKGAGLLYDPPATLAARVGDGLANRRADVATIQRLLGALGHMPEDPFDRPHGLIDRPTLDGTKSFQRSKGLTDDGWLAPGGETERALRAAIADLARAKGREWLRFAERAGRAQASLPSAFQPSRRRAGIHSDVHDPNLDNGLEAPPDGIVIPAQSRGVLGALPAPIWPWTPRDQDEEEIVPGSPADVLRKFFDVLGRGGRYGAIRPREGLPESDRPGGRAENIPPRVPDGPFRGPDPAKPPLDPKETLPAPYPAEPPTKLPDRVQNIPPRVDPREGIERYPDQSDESRKMPNVLMMEEGAKLVPERKPDEFHRRYQEWYEREGRLLEERHRTRLDYRIAPSESFIWRELGDHKPIGGRTAKTNGLSGKDRRIYQYDYGGAHPAQIEVYDARGRHLMAINPITGALVHGPDPRKKINVSWLERGDDRDLA